MNLPLSQPASQVFINHWLKKIALCFLCLVPIMMAVGRGPSDVALSLVALLFLIHSLFNRDFSWAKTLWVKAFFALWCYMVIRGFFADDWQDATISALVFVRYGMFAMAIAFWLLLTKKIERILYISVGVSVIYLSLDGLYQFIFGVDIWGKEMWSSDRLTGPFGKAILGNVILPLSLIWFYPLLNRIKGFDKSLFFIIPAVFPFFIILLSGDRSPTLLAGFSVLVLFLLSTKTMKKKFIPFMVIGLVGGLGILNTQSQVLDRQVQSIKKIAIDSQSFSYSYPFKDGVNMFKANPVFGVGFKQFSSRCNADDFTPQKTCFSHPHNFYIQMAAELGGVGLGLFIIFVASIFVSIFKSPVNWRENPLFMGAFAVIIAKFWPIIGSGNFNASWVAVGLWFAIGIVFSQLHKVKLKA